jgi:hypothetical protein
MDLEKIKFLIGFFTLLVFFSFLLGGIWTSSFLLPTKLVLTSFTTLIGGTACYHGLDDFWKFWGGIAKEMMKQ